MKKLLTIFIVIFISLQSQAVHISSNGMGQVLIFPYYTINNGLNTLMNIVNTTNQSKALRVRFREAANSKKVFTFNLYLGPYDVWTGGLVETFTEDGVITKIITSDISCTLPNISQSGQNFSMAEFGGVLSGELSDPYGADPARTREGFIEIIEMGVMVDDSAAATIIDDDQPQPNCSLLQDAWDVTSSDAYWIADPTTDMLAPSGGIMGNIILIDVATGIAVTEEPTALGNFSDSILHFAVEDASPNLADGMTLAQVENKGSIIDINWDEGFEAVSSVLMKNSISNEYVLSDSIGANTDWVLTMPTRQFHLETDAQGISANLAPFTVTNSSMISCEPYSVTGLYDREEGTPVTPPGLIVPGVSPPGVDPVIPEMCFASNYMGIYEIDEIQGDGVILGGAFHIGGDVMGANGLIPDYSEGWVALSFNGNPNINAGISNQNMSIDGTTINGLPLIGFSVQRYTNSNLSGGILANYAGLFKHKSSTTISISDNHTAKSGMMVSEQGVGQVLLFPYYTVKNGINTLISIVNTTDEVKAVKIRFNEATNGREALDFNLYLSPYDVWTAGLVATSSTIQGHLGEESAKIITSDISCTVPAISFQEFLPFAFTVAFDDDQGSNISRVQEGYFEIIEMGTVIGTDGVAATHTAAGVPSSCATLNGNWMPVTGKWSIDSSVNLVAPDGPGGLFASVSLIDVADGVDMAMDATALVGYSTELQHSEPGSFSPNLSTGNQIDTLIETETGYVKTTWSTPIDAVSALFMQSHVINDFVISPSIGAQTEWVNTFLTKPFYVDPFIATRPVPVAPFSNVISPNSGACEYHRFNAFDREQESNINFNTPIVGLPPPMSIPDSYPEDCWSVVVSDVNSGTDDNTVFASQVTLKDVNNDPDYFSINDLLFTEGWMQIDFVDEVENPGKLIGVGDNGDVHEIFGKPVLGFVAQKYINNQLTGGVLANYATINKNKGRRKFLINGMNSK